MKQLATTAIALSILLSGCTATYTLEGQKYGSAEAFQTAVDDLNVASLRVIEPLPAPVTNKRLVFALASKEAIIAASRANFEKAQGRPPTGLADEILRTVPVGNWKMIRVFGEAVQRRNIYQGVRFIDLDTTAPSSIAASAQEDVLYYYETDPRSSAWFYVSQKGGKQLFSYDRSLPGPDGKVRAFVDAVQLQAVRD